MEMHVDPRLRTHPSNVLTPSSTVTSTSSPSPGSANSNRHPSLPSLPRPSLAENPVRLPPPTASNLPSYPEPSQQRPYYQLPSAPPSTSEAPHGSPDGQIDPKRPRACESCRGLKVRCESDPKNLEGPCRRCAKAGRNCVVTVPSRKRQKKTDSRVAELEKKIDALTASLQATKSEANNDQDSDDDSDSPIGEQSRRSTLDDSYHHPSSRRSDSQGDARQTRTPTLDAHSNGQTPSSAHGGLKRKHSSAGGTFVLAPGPPDGDGRASAAAGTATDRPPATKEETPQLYPFLMPKKSNKTSKAESLYMCDSNHGAPLPNEYADVIDRQILSSELATTIFNWYVTDMAHHFPAVIFPPGTTAAEIRKTKPILFLAILAVAAGFTYPDMQRVLNKEVMKIMAERIFLNGEKTLEMVQALHVSTLWYYPPEHHEELKFYQLIHIAAVMAIDLGMGKKAKPVQKKKQVASLWRDHSRIRCGLPPTDTIEARRSWLSCYFLSSNVSQSLRRPNLIKWSPYNDDCIEFISSSADALPSDKQLCHFVRLQHIADEIGYQFSMDDPCAIVGLADLKVQYAMKNFERQLEEWHSRVPKELEAPSLDLNAHIVNLYLHEVALHVDHNIDDFHPPFTEETLKGGQGQGDLLTPTHIDALTTCLSSVHGSFDTFMSYTTDGIRTLPIFYHVRTAYCVVVLIKMYFAASAQNSELGKIINREDLKVEHYLDRMVDRYRQAAEEERCRPAGKFLMVLIMLKTWFVKQTVGPTKDGVQSVDGTPARADPDRPGASTSGGPSRYPQILSSGPSSQRYSDSQPDYSNANTPLQLLSEVAMGNQNGISNDSSAANVPSGNNWYNNYSNNNNPNGGGAEVSNYPMGANGPPNGIPPDVSQQLASALLPGESGFEESMGNAFGMTLGDEEFSNIFMNDVFFNLSMDGAPNVFENWA